MRFPPVLGTLLVTCLTTLGSADAIAQANHKAGPAGMPGSARDAHGCITSAGYTWCTHAQRCERPWELAQEHGFDATKEAFDQYCGGSKQDKDPQRRDQN